MAEVVVYEEKVVNVKWGTFVLLGLLALIIGIVIFIYPAMTAAVLVMLLGVLILVLSFMTLVAASMVLVRQPVRPFSSSCRYLVLLSDLVLSSLPRYSGPS